jgi:hypothetical protein
VKKKVNSSGRAEEAGIPGWLKEVVIQILYFGHYFFKLAHQ